GSRQKSRNERGDKVTKDSDKEGRKGEVEEDPALFVLPNDNTGKGIDYGILGRKTWDTLRDYCTKWGIKQAHLETIYSRFERTILRTEHLDFTKKPQFHVSLDFLA
ncbi:unnamed protein product, partial [Discosporangium mesarthrocarpum]